MVRVWLQSEQHIMQNFDLKAKQGKQQNKINLQTAFTFDNVIIVT